MDVLENPFFVLGATTRDDRRRIMGLAEEKSLLSEEEVAAEASSALTNPRKRLAAEVGWIPGVAPRRGEALLKVLQLDPGGLYRQTSLPPLARANLLASALPRVAQSLSTEEVTDWIFMLASVHEKIDTESTIRLLNEERGAASFPAITDTQAVESELQGRQQYYRAAIKEALNSLASKELVKVVTETVKKATDDGVRHAPILVDDLVDAFEAEALGFLEQETKNIDSLIEQVRSAAVEEHNETVLTRLVSKLEHVVKNWDLVAQPIQVSARSRGLDHALSHQVAGELRGLAVELFNEHDQLEISQRLTTLIQETFAEVERIVELCEEDENALNKIAENRAIHFQVFKIKELTEQIKDDVESGQPDSYLSSKIGRLCQLVKNLEVDSEKEASQQAAWLVRNLAIHMFNEHQKLNFSQQITTTLLEMFRNAGELSSRLADDARALQELASTPAEPPRPKVFPLLEMTKFPTLPAPWSSVDAGETWIWGDFFLTFQKKPQMMVDFLTEKLHGNKPEYKGLFYHYSMSVFYRCDRNPHGMSARPIMIATLEQADQGMAARRIAIMVGTGPGELLQAEVGEKMGPLMVCLFSGTSHSNFGEYDGGMSPQAVKRRFFEILGYQLGLSGQPKMIGDLAAAYGHPETGLSSQKNNSGCLAVIFLCVGIGGLGIFGVTEILRTFA